MSQTDKELVEAKEEAPKPKKAIKFGQLRERVKKGELDPKEVLAWYREQPEQWSDSLVTFLKNQVVAKKKKKEEKKEDKKPEEGKKDKRKGKQKRRKREQSGRASKRD